MVEYWESRDKPVPTGSIQLSISLKLYPSLMLDRVRALPFAFWRWLLGAVLLPWFYDE
jgi:hypothetical protein